MVTQVDATLSNGVLKPDKPLALADQTRVRLTIEPIEQVETSLIPDEEVVRQAVADFEAGRFRTL